MLDRSTFAVDDDELVLAGEDDGVDRAYQRVAAQFVAPRVEVKKAIGTLKTNIKTRILF